MVVLFDMVPRQSRGGKLDYVERLHRNTQFFQKQYPYFYRTIMQLKNHKFFLILENPKTSFIFFPNVILYHIVPSLGLFPWISMDSFLCSFANDAPVIYYN